MKIAQTPSQIDLQKAYENLEWSKPEAISIDTLILWVQWSRLDARLAEILILFFVKSFQSINPFILWRSNLHSPLPQTLMVLLAFAKVRAKDQIPLDELKDFLVWAKILEKGVRKTSPQMFFIHEGLPKPDRDQNEIARNLSMYQRWGFFSAEFLAVNKQAQVIQATHITKSQRLFILEQLLQTQETVTVQDYLQACGKQIHRRTAERDLSEHPQLRKKGYTRNRRYVKRQSLAMAPLKR